MNIYGLPQYNVWKGFVEISEELRFFTTLFLGHDWFLPVPETFVDIQKLEGEEASAYSSAWLIGAYQYSVLWQPV